VEYFATIIVQYFPTGWHIKSGAYVYYVDRAIGHFRTVLETMSHAHCSEG